MKLIFDAPTFSYEILRTLSYAPYGGADVGEVLATGYKIKEGNFESWYSEWSELANQLEQRGEASESKNDCLGASQAYFKASNYYRSAEFFLHGDATDPRLLAIWRKSRDTFQKALLLGKINAEVVAIPYEKTTMPGYFYKVDETPRPTMLIHGGYDSTGEELYFQVVKDALAHGYNALTFEGPGQGGMIREQHLSFRPDWEKVVSCAVDYLETRDEVQKDKIVLMGISFGGLLASRAAAFEHRLAAVIADDGLFSFQFSKAFEAHSEAGKLSDAEMAREIRGLMDRVTQVRWVIENGLFTFGADSISTLFEKTEAYTLDGIASQIACPALICEATNDMFFKGQPEMLYSAIQSPKTLMVFADKNHAEEH